MFWIFLELEDGVITFEIFGIVKLLCSVEFVLLTGSLKAQRARTIFRTTPNLPH